ncbi:MAG: DNA internalization-related competence protein ComEC/Rec2 [Gammaproteobacteria bacterium]|nr:DNA internalization-related competence protein ComEC/Rec2 [Gammaproteobacteria bacterium]
MNKVIPTVLRLPVCALAFLSGVVCLQLQSHLPDLYWSGLLVVAVAVSYRRKKHYWFIFLLAGFFSASLQGWHYIQAVPDQSLARQDILISGVVVDLPVRGSRAIKFRIDIEHFKLTGYSGAVPERIQLSWYYSTVDIRPGDRWQLMVRLKPPSGLQNPGGFDYEAWLYQQNIHATGYVRTSSLNKKIAEANALSLVDRQRFNIRQLIQANAGADEAALLSALSIGYRGDISPENWQLFINTGTNHLIAISGLHIALMAGFAWTALRLVSRISFLQPYFGHRSLLLYSFIVAYIYAALAGFTIPTQRALVMLAVVYAGLFFYRQLTVLQSLSLALIVVLIVSPSSVLSVGFWLSFLAVAAISYSLAGRLPGRNKILLWLWPQLVVIVVLMPLGFYFFQQTSLIALLANIVAIPLVGMLILPLLMLALLLAPLHDGLSAIFIAISADCLSYLLMLLRYLADFEYAVWVHSETSFIALLLAMIGLLILFAPTAFPARFLSVFLLMPLLLHKVTTLPDAVFELHVLDVGQGLSVLISTKSHHLLFDAGGRSSERFDVGEKVVVPFLRHQGIKKLDRVVISNGDNDHIGGAQAVLDVIETVQVIGRDIEMIKHKNKQHCIKGQSWNWDGVDFEILHPQHQRYRKRNNYSCVLKISNAVNSVLIAGDIEKRAENELLSQQAFSLRANVLIVPHHGSKTSSSMRFIKAVKPEIAIYSIGYLNRYDFPRPEVVGRYQQQGVSQLNTADKGQISLLLDQSPLFGRAQGYRQQKRRYWHRTEH